MNHETIYKRNCPKCQAVIYHANSSNYKKSIERNSLCKTCHQTERTERSIARQGLKKPVTKFEPLVKIAEHSERVFQMSDGAWYRICKNCKKNVKHFSKGSAVHQDINATGCKYCYETHGEKTVEPVEEFEITDGKPFVVLKAYSRDMIESSEHTPIVFQFKRYGIECPYCKARYVKNYPADWLKIACRYCQKEIALK